jgi:hypothetical protein
LRRWLALPLPVWRVDGGDDELVDIVTPLLGCGGRRFNWRWVVEQLARR